MPSAGEDMSMVAVSNRVASWRPVVISTVSKIKWSRSNSSFSRRASSSVGIASFRLNASGSSQPKAVASARRVWMSDGSPASTRWTVRAVTLAISASVSCVHSRTSRRVRTSSATSFGVSRRGWVSVVVMLVLRWRVMRPSSPAAARSTTTTSRQQGDRTEDTCAASTHKDAKSQASHCTEQAASGAKHPPQAP